MSSVPPPVPMSSATLAAQLPTKDERSARPGAAAPTSSRRAGRLPALDGLRGIAALVVVVFHVLILSDTFAEPAPGVRPQEPSWWFTHTPLAVGWSGVEAVLLFFVLSGFVLALPATAAPVSWRAYYPQRLVRLYLPVWASLLLAAAVAALVPRVSHPELSGWYDAHVPDVGAGEIVHDGFLLLGAGWLNSPLWSLQWELWFSLLLPVYLVLARWQPRLWALKVLAMLALVVAAPAVGRSDVMYMSVFAFGVLLAFERERLARAVARVRLLRIGWLVAVACAVLLTVETVLLVGEVDSGALRGVARALEVLGAAGAVVLALHWDPFRRWLSRPWAQWVGIRSFSLYLVHEPLVVSSAALWPGLPVLVHLAIVLPVALLVAHVFHRLVEKPSHLLSRAAGRRLAA